MSLVVMVTRREVIMNDQVDCTAKISEETVGIIIQGVGEIKALAFALIASLEHGLYNDGPECLPITKMKATGWLNNFDEKSMLRVFAECFSTKFDGLDSYLENLKTFRDLE